VERIGQVGEGIQGISAQFSDAVRLAVAQSEDISRVFETQGQQLIATAGSAQQTAGELREVFRDEIEQLGRLAKELQVTAQGVGEAVGGHASELSRAHAESSQSTQEIRGELRAQADELAALEQAVIERLTGIGQKIETIIVGLLQGAERARTRVAGLGAEFDSQTAVLGQSLDGVYRRIDECGQAFRKQADGLLRASETVEAQAQALRESEGERRRDVFLRSATHMIEDLNASAIDLNRILAEDMPDDLWKRYQKGDRSIFARRLLRGKDRLVLPDVKARFETDERFRVEANRYIKQFETLLTQATDCDPENVLNTTFLTADVGKLYIILSRSLGRTQ
jgi:hypothetical protein